MQLQEYNTEVHNFTGENSVRFHAKLVKQGLTFVHAQLYWNGQQQVQFYSGAGSEDLQLYRYFKFARWRRRAHNFLQVQRYSCKIVRWKGVELSQMFTNVDLRL